MFKKLIVLCFCALVFMGQTTALPKIGEIMEYSGNKKVLKTGCFTTYDTVKGRFVCLNAALSASFRARSMLTSRGTAITIAGSTFGRADVLQLLKAPATNQYFGFDFTLPSYKVEPQTLTVSWYSAGTGDARWQLEWCRYAEGEPSCSPIGQNVQTVVSTASPLRTDFSFSLKNLEWKASDGIVIHFTRMYNNSLDTLSATAFVERVRLEATTDLL